MAMHCRSELAGDFRSLGVAPGDVVMLHASIRAVGPVAGGPDEIHLAVKDALSDRGTLLMYASCPRTVDEIGRGNLSSAEEEELLAKLPPFDALTARSARDNGALVELLRTYPGSKVNDHVVRFVAWGARADALLAEQPWDFAYGHGSTLERFLGLGGKILLLGSDHDAVTFLHHTEHVIDLPDKRVTTFRVPVRAPSGERVWREMREFDTAEGAHEAWRHRTAFFATLIDGYLARAEHGVGRVGDAPAVLFDAAGLHEFALARMQEIARV
jgi:aminoglycoside 3-N-acetyltransferase